MLFLSNWRSEMWYLYLKQTMNCTGKQYENDKNYVSCRAVRFTSLHKIKGNNFTITITGSRKTKFVVIKAHLPEAGEKFMTKTTFIPHFILTLPIIKASWCTTKIKLNFTESYCDCCFEKLKMHYLISCVTNMTRAIWVLLFNFCHSHNNVDKKYLNTWSQQRFLFNSSDWIVS